MENPTWFIGQKESPQTLYSFVLAPMVLHNYPQYSRLFFNTNMPDECPMVGRIEDVRSTLGKMFGIEVEYVKPNSLSKLQENDKTMMMFRHYHGHIYPKGFDTGEHVLKVEAVDKNIRYVDIPKVLYEYGQMINYKVMTVNNLVDDERVKTAVDTASVFMGFDEKHADTEESVWAYAYGKQLTGWVNGIWLAWMLGVDQKSMLMAIVLNEIEDSHEEPEEFVEYVWDKYRDYLLDKRKAEALFKQAGPYDFTALHATKSIDELMLCRQIDKSTELLIGIMINDEMVSVAEDEIKQMQEQGLSVNH